MSVYSCFDVHIFKIVSHVVKLLGIYVWIEAHACETSNVIKKKLLHTFVNLSLLLCSILFAFATILREMSLYKLGFWERVLREDLLWKDHTLEFCVCGPGPALTRIFLPQCSVAFFFLNKFVNFYSGVPHLNPVCTIYT